MFNVPTPAEKKAAEAAAGKNPITAAAISSAVAITQRVLVTLLEEHGVDVSGLKPAQLADHIQTIAVANSAAGMATIFQELKKVLDGESRAEPILLLMQILDQDRGKALMEGIDTAAEIARMQALTMANNTTEKFDAFTKEHPSPFYAAMKETEGE